MTLLFILACVGAYCVITFGAVLGLLSLAEVAGQWTERRHMRKTARLAQAAELEAEAARYLGGPYRAYAAFGTRRL